MHEAMIVSYSPDSTCVDELSNPAREHCSGISWRQTEPRVGRQRVEHSGSPTAATVLLLNGLGHRGGGAARGLRTTLDLESTGRLYIDDCKMPTTLREVDQIQDMRPIRAYRIGTLPKGTGAGL